MLWLAGFCHGYAVSACTNDVHVNIRRIASQAIIIPAGQLCTHAHRYTHVHTLACMSHTHTHTHTHTILHTHTLKTHWYTGHHVCHGAKGILSIQSCLYKIAFLECTKALLESQSFDCSHTGHSLHAIDHSFSICKCTMYNTMTCNVVVRPLRLFQWAPMKTLQLCLKTHTHAHTQAAYTIQHFLHVSKRC